MNKTIPHYEPPVTERELRSVIETPVVGSGCCSNAKVQKDTNATQPTEERSGCCCH